MSNPETDLKQVAASLAKINDDVKALAEKAQADLKNLGAVSAETKAKADEALAKQGEIAGRLTEIEQKLAEKAKGAGAERKTIGASVVENAEVKAFMAKNGRGSVKVEVKAITSASDSAGDLVRPDRLNMIIAPPDRRLTVRNLITPGNTGSSSIEYVQETGFTNLARPVTEAQAKPESNIEFELVSSPVRTIAHWVQASRQILADAPMLRSYIDGRLRYGLAYKEELQLLKGDGTGQNLHGIVPQATAFDPAFTPTFESRIDTIRLAMLQATLAEYPASGTVLHPTDWARIELTKDQEGRYVFANPLGLAGNVLWSRPVVDTQAMDEGEFLTGAFMLGAQIFDREDATVEISTEDRDNFIKNMVTLLAEERVGLAVYRPEAFITGEFPAVSG